MFAATIRRRAQARNPMPTSPKPTTRTARPPAPAKSREPAPAAVAPTPERERLFRLLAPLLLAVAGVLAYANSLGGPLVFDDVINIRENAKLRRPWPIWESMWGPLKTGVSGRPVVQLSFVLNHAIHGLDVGGYHLVNLLLHLAAALLLFGVVRRTLASPALAPRFGAHATPLAFCVALLWEVHPLLSDSVTYISGRTEILAGLFLLMTLNCAISGAASANGAHTGRARGWYVAALLACALGTGCKEIMVAAPLLVLLYDRLFLSASFRQALRERGWVYAGLLATLALIPLNLYMADFHRSALVGADVMSPWDYLKTQAQVIVMYLRLSFWPHPLVIDYQGWPTHPPLARVLPHALLIVALLALTVAGLFRLKPAAYAGAWFFLILAPTSSVLPLPTEIATERRMYLPLMAIVALVMLGGYRLVVRLSARAPASTARFRYAAMGAVGVIVLAAGVRTAARNEVFKDPVVLLSNVIQHQPNNTRAINNRAYELLGRGDVAAAKRDYLRAVELDPSNYLGLNNLATIYMSEGNDGEAIRCLRASIAVKSDYDTPHYNLARIYYKRGDFAESERAARGALAINPGSAPAHDQLGLALARTNRTAEALAEFRKAYELSPGNTQYLTHAAWYLAAADDPAVRNPKEAINIAGQVAQAGGGADVESVDALALAFAAAGRFPDAVTAASHALDVAKQQVSPRAAAIEGRLAAYKARRMPDESLRHFGP
jgi:Flp pilus assembly protein TadD